jgi:hypothetical protein
VGKESKATERRFSFEATCDVIWKCDYFIGGGENELTWVQDKCLSIFGDDLASQLWLFQGWVDDLILMVFKDPEELVEANIDRGGLNHRFGEWLDAYTLGFDLGTDIAVT